MVFSDFPFNECAGGKSLKNSDFVDRCVRPPAPINLFRSHLVRSSVRVKLYFPSNESFFFVVQSCTMGQLHPQDYGMLVQYPDAGEDSSFVCQLSPGYHQRSEFRENIGLGMCGSPVQLASRTNGSEGGRLLIVSLQFSSRS